MSPRSLVLGTVVFLAACGGRQSGPERALGDYSAALRAGDFGSAYDLMSEEFHRKHSKDEFVRMMKESSREAGETAGRLRQDPKSVEISAEFNFGLGDSMRLVQEDGEWRIASNPMDFYSQASPRDALRSFVRAYSLKRWDVMLRFVPTKYRERMTVDKMREQFDGQLHREEVQSMMNMIQANLDEPIIDKGTEARMPYGDRFEVKFVLEEGKWKVQDLD